MFIVIIAGPPGSGKGTQAGLLAAKLGFVHISTGDILRREIEEGTKLGQIAKARIDDGNFVTDEIACEMIINVLNSLPNADGFVFDGFPRTYYQCGAFEDVLKPFNKVPDLFVELKVPKQELVRRLQERNRKAARPDDSDLSIINHRLLLYSDVTKPITQWYKEKEIYVEIDGSGSVDNVQENLLSIISDKRIK